MHFFYSKTGFYAINKYIMQVFTHKIKSVPNKSTYRHLDNNICKGSKIDIKMPTGGLTRVHYFQIIQNCAQPIVEWTIKVQIHRTDIYLFYVLEEIIIQFIMNLTKKSLFPFAFIYLGRDHQSIEEIYLPTESIFVECPMSPPHETFH